MYFSGINRLPLLLCVKSAAQSKATSCQVCYWFQGTGSGNFLKGKISFWPHRIWDHHNRTPHFFSPFVWGDFSNPLGWESIVHNYFFQAPAAIAFLLVLFSHSCRLGAGGFFRDGWNFGWFRPASRSPWGVGCVRTDWTWILKLRRIRSIAATATAGSAACLAARSTGGAADRGSSSLWIWQNESNSRRLL